MGSRIVADGDGVDPYAPDSPGGRLDYLEDCPVVGGELLTGLGDRLSQGHAQSGNRRTVLADG